MPSQLPEPTSFDEEHFITLAARHFAGDLEGDDAAIFETLLERFPEAREALLDLALQAQTLHETSASHRSHFPRGGTRWKAPLVWIGAAAAAVTLGAWLWSTRLQTASPHPFIARVTDVQGNVGLLPGHHGPSVPQGEANAVLHSADGVITRTPDSQAIVRFLDGTEVTVTGDTEAWFDETERGKRVLVHRGRVSADVTPQPPGRPLVIQTPTAELTIVGTTLCVAAEDDETRLDVTSGKVAITRRADGSRTDVSAGQFAVVNAASSDSVTAMRIPELPAQWHPVLNDQWTGNLQRTKDKPELHAERSQQGYHSIQAPNAWDAGSYGHFQASPQSHLHLTFKMDRPEWFHIITCTRTPPHAEDSAEPTANFIYQDASWWKDLQPGEWRTVSIPLANGRRPGRDTPQGITHAANRVIYTLLISTNEHDRGLTVKRIWVDDQPK